MEVEGKIKKIDEVKTYGTSGFKKRELVLVTEEQYPQYLLIEFVQEKCEILNNYKPGDEVKISINLKGREWVNPEGEVKYFNSIQGWRIDKAQNNANGRPPLAPLETFDPLDSDTEDAHDDLPF